MGILDRLVILARSLHQPQQKPADVAELDARLDAVERRMDEARRQRLQIELDSARRSR